MKKSQGNREIPNRIPREVLIVEDDAETSRLLSAIIKRIDLPINVMEVDTGVAAWNLIKRFKIIGVVFVDLHLPGGLDGMTLGCMIRNRCPMMVVNAMTGYSDLFTLEECRRNGFDDYFAKPIGIDDLQLAVLRAFCKMERWRYGEVPPDLLKLIARKMEC